MLILHLVVCLPEAFSQSIVRSTTGSSGSSQTVISNNISYFVSQSVGQTSVIGTSTTGDISLRQCCHQPRHTCESGASEGLSDLQAVVYPNPFQQTVHISFVEEVDEDVAVIMHDISGRIILNKTLPLKSPSEKDFGIKYTSGISIPLLGLFSFFCLHVLHPIILIFI